MTTAHDDGLAVDLLAAALGYAAAGIPVLPLHTPVPGGGCSCRTGTACSSVGKHPRLAHGLHDASRNAQTITAWWMRWPAANIGVRTGTALDVCDIDTDTGLRRILDLLDVIRPPGPLIRTGAGWHLWYAGGDLPSRVGFLPGIDWRGRGGYAVAPPSLHASGRRYQFQQPCNNTLAPCPPQLRDLIVPAPPPVLPSEPIGDTDRYAQAALAGEIARLLRAARPVHRDGLRVSAGGRNDALNRAAFRLGQLAANLPMDEAAVRRELTDAALSTGLGRTEIHRTIASGWRAGLRHPRRFGDRRPAEPDRGATALR